MSNFKERITIDGEELEFSFSLIHYPGGERYLVLVTNGKKQVANFYMEKTERGTWKLADQFKIVPKWVHPLEGRLVEAIEKNYRST